MNLSYSAANFLLIRLGAVLPDIFDCSIKLRSEVNKIEEALCELVPYMVRQYHQMHSRLSVVSV